MTATPRHAPLRFTARSFALVLGIVFSAGANALPNPSAPEILGHIDALIDGGTPQLALRIVEKNQPADSNDAVWEEFERRRLLVYRAMADLTRLAERVETLPEASSPEFRRWALEQMAEAAAAARDLGREQAALRELIAELDGAEAIPWRERLVRSYLSQGRIEEARNALQPFVHHEAVRVLHAELLLRSGLYGEAIARLEGIKSPDAQLLRATARLWTGMQSPADVARDLAVLVRELSETEYQRSAWLVRAEAAGLAGQLGRRINSLEQGLKLGEPGPGAFVAANPGMLWSAYFDLGRQLAAHQRLSATDGRAVAARAEGYLKTDVYSARALYAWLAREADDAATRAAAHEQLALSLIAQGFAPVVHSLYRDPNEVPGGEVPASVRHRLVEDALARQQLRRAADLAADLQTPDANESHAAWALRRARLLVYGGRTRVAVASLGDLVDMPEFDVDFASRYLQVVFDLQSIGLHREALPLLQAVYARIDEPRMRRELLYWQAESAVGLERYADAAELYLRSARFGDNNGADPWGHSARFQAAEALAKAGLSSDAEAVYRGLLKETADSSRRALIEQNIQRLWLAAPPRTTP